MKPALRWLVIVPVSIGLALRELAKRFRAGHIRRQRVKRILRGAIEAERRKQHLNE